MGLIRWHVIHQKAKNSTSFGFVDASLFGESDRNSFGGAKFSVLHAALAPAAGGAGRAVVTVGVGEGSEPHAASASPAMKANNITLINRFMRSSQKK